MSELDSLKAEAVEFLELFPWCKKVITLSPEIEFGDMLGIYLATFAASGQARSPAWVLVGNVPPTVLPMENGWNLSQTLENHLLNLAAWVEAVERGESDMLKYTPVLYRKSTRRLPPTPDNAALTRRAIAVMRGAIADYLP